MRRHRLIIACVVVLVVAACGGGAADDSTLPPQVESATTPADSEPSETTQASEETTTSSAEGAAEPVTESAATVTIGSAIYHFAVLDEGGSCDPDFLGGMRALMTRVDESGNAVASSESGGTDGITITAAPPDIGVIALSADGMNWSAGGDGNDDSSIDSVTKDGNQVEGTATFVSDGAEGPTQGTFEATCVGG